MKAALFIAAVALVQVAFTSPIQYRDVDDVDDVDDNECGAPEPEPSPVSPAPSSSSAAPGPSEVPSKESGSGLNPYTSNGLKAGLSGFVGIATNDQGGFGQLAVSRPL